MHKNLKDARGKKTYKNAILKKPASLRAKFNHILLSLKEMTCRLIGSSGSEKMKLSMCRSLNGLVRCEE